VTLGAIYFTEISPGSWETICWSLVAFMVVVVIAQLLARL
jgi:hypothetical protein